MKLTGHIAIEFAEANGMMLNKYNDPTEAAREDLTPDEARAVAREDSRLIWIETPLLVIDGFTDEAETASTCEICPLVGGKPSGTGIAVEDERVIRALYSDPSAKSYGEGSYTVGA